MYDRSAFEVEGSHYLRGAVQNRYGSVEGHSGPYLRERRLALLLA